MSYRDYLQDSTLELSHYRIYKETSHSEHLVVCKACLKSAPDRHFYIKKEKFEKTGANLARFFGLVHAYNQGIVILASIFLEETDTGLLLYSIEPLCEPTMESLNSLLSKNSLSLPKRKELFFCLISTVDKLHSLGIPHLELCPSNILIDSTVSAYLRSFPMSFSTRSTMYHYSPPEELSGLSFYSGSFFSNDVWALGCIFAELFVCLTPLFQAVTHEEKTMKMFEVLGVPNFCDVENYMSWDTYKDFRASVNQENSGLLFEGLAANEQKMVVSMLAFSPERRPTCKEIALFDLYSGKSKLFETQESCTSEPPMRVIHEPLRERTRLMSHLTWHGDASQNDYAQTELKAPDNTLYVTIIAGKNLENSRGDLLSFNYEINGCGRDLRAKSKLYEAAREFSIDFNEKFQINSEWFKAFYCHKPIVIAVCQGSSSEKAHQRLLGSCEVYIGSLFAPLSLYNPDNTVIGYYNIETTGGVLGQLKIEVKSNLTIGKSHNSVPAPTEDLSILSAVKDTLSQLTFDLREKADIKEQQLKEETEFDITIRELRRLLLK